MASVVMQEALNIANANANANAPEAVMKQDRK